jgi:ubiquitin-protein ligase
MQVYQAICYNKPNQIKQLDKLNSLIQFIKNIKSFKLSDDFVGFNLWVQNKSKQNTYQNYPIKIYWDNIRDKRKLTYMLTEFEITNKFEEILSERIFDINNNIDQFEELEDILYELNTYISDCQIYLDDEKDGKHDEKNSDSNILASKNMSIFVLQLEEFKNQAKKILTTNRLFSSESMCEMLGDQLVKIYKETDYNVKIKTLHDFTIEITNFNFENMNVKQDVNLNDIGVFIQFMLPHDFISSPPVLNITSTHIFKYNIFKVIEKLKPFNDNNSWSIKYSIHNTISNIKKIFNKYGELEYVATSPLDKEINELEYLLTIKDQNISENKLLYLFDENLAKELNNFVNTNPNNPNTQTKYWKAGTGYGHQGATTWNFDDYAKSLEQRKEKINLMMGNLIKSCNKNVITPTDIPKLKNLFKFYMLNGEIDPNIISGISQLIVFNYANFDDDSFSKTLNTIKDYFVFNNIVNPFTALTKSQILDKMQDTNVKVNSKLDEFQSIFNDWVFKFYEGNFTSFYYDQQKNITNNTLSPTQISRLHKEFYTLKNSIVITKNASIFFSVQKNNINKIRFVISGPNATPYDLGLFIFDMTIGQDFPTGPPLVQFSNNGGKRFNPNLYDNGKVCLSLLGTWKGEKGESWNSTMSSFYQLVISIQSQILIDEPYFNEPGHEKSIGTASGIAYSKEYNSNIRQYTLDHTINDLLENSNSYKEFDFVIKNYFKFNKTSIQKTITKWLEEMQPAKYNKFKASVDKFALLAAKLV